MTTAKITAFSLYILIISILICGSASAAQVCSSTTALWKFESNLADSSPNHHDGTFKPSGSPTYATGKIGSGIKLNGINQYVYIPPHPTDFDVTTSISDDWTIDLWVKEENLVPKNCELVSRGCGSSGPSPWWQFTLNELWNISFWSYSAVPNIMANGSYIYDGNWHHVAMVKKAANIGLYVDGIQVGYDTQETGWDPDCEVLIGAVNWISSIQNFFKGTLDEVRVSHGNIFDADPDPELTDSFFVNPEEVWYKDADNDGYGDSDSEPLAQCSRPAGYKGASELAATTGDCDDDNPAINPGAAEACNGIDDNCDDQIDEGGVCSFKCRVDTACQSWETDVLHISSLFNAHAELPPPPQGNYPYKICCQGPVTLGISCTAGTTFLKLSSPTNAHVEKAMLYNYSEQACISGTLISCAYGSDCGDDACLASISGDSNAHIANCTGDGSYPTKVCCSLDDIAPPSISLDYMGPSGNHWLGESENVTFIAAASDPLTGIKEIKLYVNGELKNTCASSPCEWTSSSGFSAGETVGFSASATDNADNTGTNSSQFTRCKLDMVSINPYDCGIYGCEQGNKIRVSATFSGNTCPAQPYIQVDAQSAGGSCKIEAKLKSEGGNGDMKGISTQCTAGSPCAGEWEIPAVPEACKGEMVSAVSASIRDVLNPDIWRQFGFVENPPSNPSGSFTLRDVEPSLIRVWASATYVKQGAQVTIYSETSGGEGTKRLDCTYGSTGLCSGSAESNPSCTFNSPWSADGVRVVQCWVYDEDAGFSSNKTVSLVADNTPPSITWNAPPSLFYRNTGTNRDIAIDASVSDSGAGVSNGANCNPKIDGGTSSFTGSVVYSSSAGKCMGTITLNAGGLPEGSHTLTLDVPDNSTAPNIGYSTARQLIVDNTPPQAWIYAQPDWPFGLPKWKNASSQGVVFPVIWGGTDANSPTGGNLTFNVQFGVFDASGAQIVAWTDTGSSTGNSTLVFGPAPPNYEGKNISFRVEATDQAGNEMTYERWGTVMDTIPPSCQMGEPYVIASGNKFTRNGFWFVNGRYNVPWEGTDSTTPGGIASGAASYDVNIEPGTSGWQAIETVPYCNSTGLPPSPTSTACGIGDNDYLYGFSCRSIDAAGNIGPWSSVNISVKVDTQPPLSFFGLLHEWMGRNQSEWMGSEYFNLSWNDNNDDYPGSGVRCFFVRWSNSTTRANPDPAERWVNLTSAYNPDDPACLSPAMSSRYFEFGNSNTLLKDNETYNFSIMSIDNIGNAELFDSWASGSEYSARVKNTTIDRYEPFLNSWVKDSSGKIIQPGYLDSSMTTYVNITSNASDNISGIYSNIIYLTIVQKSISSYISAASEQSDCVGGEWSTPPYSGGNRTCTVRIDYAEGTSITYNAVATDRANNTNWTSGVVTTHPLSNFLVHLVIMSLGSGVDIPAQVRNTEKTTQNLTIGLEGFSMAAFIPSDQLVLVEPCSSLGRCANITLSPGEERTIYVRLMANEITDGPVDLNLTAVSSSGVLDNDTASIIIGYPADFPAFDAWWAVLLMMIFAGIVFYRTEAPA